MGREREKASSLGAILQESRERAGLCLATLGRMIGVTGQAIGLYERNIMRPIKTRFIELVIALELDEATLEEAISLFGEEVTREEIAAKKNTAATEEVYGRSGSRSIAAFLSAPRYKPLILAILAAQEDGKLKNKSRKLVEVIEMARSNRLSFTQEAWIAIIAAMEVDNG